MASAFDDDLAALEKQRSELLQAQAARGAALQELTAKRLKAAEALLAAEVQSAKLAAEARSH